MFADYRFQSENSEVKMKRIPKFEVLICKHSLYSEDSLKTAISLWYFINAVLCNRLLKEICYFNVYILLIAIVKHYLSYGCAKM